MAAAAAVRSLEGDRVLSVIESTGALSGRGGAAASPRDWKWDLVSALFSWMGEALSAGMDAGGGGANSAGGSPHYQFARRVLDFYRPSSSKFSRVELTDAASRTYVGVGCVLMDFLAKSKSVGSDGRLNGPSNQ